MKTSPDVENGISWLEGLLEVKALRSDATEQCKEIRKAIKAIKGQAKQIHNLAAENDRLAKMFAENTYIESAVVEPGYYDLRLRGQGAMLLVGQIIQIFRDSGGKNFSTNTLKLTLPDGKTREIFELTIQKVNGEDSPAQKLERQAKRIEALEYALAKEHAISLLNFQRTDEGETRSWDDLTKEEQDARIDFAKTCLKRGGKL